MSTLTRQTKTDQKQIGQRIRTQLRAKAAKRGGFRYARPALYDIQKQAIFHRQRYAYVETAPQVGKTIGALSWLIEHTIRDANKMGWWVSPTHGQAKVVYERAKKIFNKKLWASHDTDKLFTYQVNGSRIQFKSAEVPDNLYTETVDAMVVDEASRITDRGWAAALSRTSKTNGPIRVIGNKHGRGWFYRLCRQAEQGTAPSSKYASMSGPQAVHAGLMRVEKLEMDKASLPDSMFRELYLLEDVDDANPFGYSKIAACIAPLSTDPPVVYGIDLAKSVDWTVIIGLDSQKRVSVFDRWHKVDWGSSMERIAAQVKGVRTYIDATGVGDPIVEMIAQKPGCERVEPFVFTAASKQRIMERLAVNIQQQQVAFPAGEIETELNAFEFQVGRLHTTYNAPAGLHDDCVCALALAVEMIETPEPRWW